MRDATLFDNMKKVLDRIKESLRGCFKKSTSDIYLALWSRFLEGTDYYVFKSNHSDEPCPIDGLVTDWKFTRCCVLHIQHS